MGNPNDRHPASPQEEGLRRLSVRLGAACRPCPELGGDLAVICLCPCQVAVARRLLLAASQVGTDPGLLDAGPRGALRLQAWASSERTATCDLEALEQRLAELASLHQGCELPGCLACEARSQLEALVADRQLTGSR